MEPGFVAVNVAVLVIANEPGAGDEAIQKTVTVPLELAGHKIAKSGFVKDAEDAIRAQLAEWTADAGVDVVIVAAATDSEVAAPALAPLVTKPVPGFTDLFRYLAYQEIGPSAMLSNAEAAQCGPAFVFILPASLEAVKAAVHKLIVPQLDARTKPRNLIAMMPRKRPAIPAIPKLPKSDAVPAAVVADERTKAGYAGPPKTPAVVARTGAIEVPKIGAPAVPPAVPAVPPRRPTPVPIAGAATSVTTSGGRIEPPARPTPLPSVMKPATAPMPSTSLPSTKPAAPPAAAAVAAPAIAEPATSPFETATPVPEPVSKQRASAPATTLTPATTLRAPAATTTTTTSMPHVVPRVTATSGSVHAEVTRVAPAPVGNQEVTRVAPHPHPNAGDVTKKMPPAPPADITKKMPPAPAASASTSASTEDEGTVRMPPQPELHGDTVTVLDGDTAEVPQAPLRDEDSHPAFLRQRLPDPDEEVAPPPRPNAIRATPAAGSARAPAEAPRATSAADRVRRTPPGGAARPRVEQSAVDLPASSIVELLPPVPPGAELDAAEEDAENILLPASPPPPKAPPPIPARARVPTPPPLPVVPASVVAAITEAAAQAPAAPAAPPARPRVPTPGPLSVVPASLTSTPLLADTDLPQGDFEYPRLKKSARGPILAVLGMGAALAAGFLIATRVVGNQRDRNQQIAAQASTAQTPAPPPPTPETPTPPAPPAPAPEIDIDPSAGSATAGPAVAETPPAHEEPSHDQPAPVPPPRTPATAPRPTPRTPTTRTPATPTPRTPTTVARVAQPPEHETPHETPAEPPPREEPAREEPPKVVASPDPGCDEVSCVLDKYERACCARFKPADKGFTPPPAGPAASLDKTMIRAGVATMKPVVIGCGEKTPAHGIVKIALVVDGDGHVTDANVVDSPDPALGNCVAGALRKAKFAKTENGGSFTYPFSF